MGVCDARVLVAILAAAFNLRIGISVVGPAIESIRLDIGMSRGLAGALTMIPFACMGLFAFLGPPLPRRWGSATVVILALTLIAAGSAARAGAEQPWLLLVARFLSALGSR